MHVRWMIDKKILFVQMHFCSSKQSLFIFYFYLFFFSAKFGKKTQYGFLDFAAFAAWWILNSIFFLSEKRTCGYGDDGLLLSPRFHGDHLCDLRIEEDNAFVWKSIVMIADERIQFAWGGFVLVIGKGGEELFKCEHGMVSIG